MHCRSCGKELPDGTNFCDNCGVPQRDGLLTAQTIMERQGQQAQPVKPQKDGPLVYFAKGILMSIIIMLVMGAVAFGACILLISGLGSGH